MDSLRLEDRRDLLLVTFESLAATFCIPSSANEAHLDEQPREPRFSLLVALLLRCRGLLRLRKGEGEADGGRRDVGGDEGVARLMAVGFGRSEVL